MSDARTAEPERLPWIANENESGEGAPGRRMRGLGPWVLAALSAAVMLLVLALAYWIAMNNWQMPLPQSQQAEPTETAPLPQAQKAVPAPPHSLRKHVTHAHKSAGPRVSLPALREVPLHLPSRTSAQAKSAVPKQVAQSKSAAQTKVAAKSERVAIAKIQPTNELSPRTVATAQTHVQHALRRATPGLPPSAYAMRGPPPFMTRPLFASPQAEGRVVQVGAFKDIHEAKLWWNAMVRAYPQVGQLQPSMIESRYPNGVPFYRFQIGTSSQANSVMLCQMMQRINLSCGVTGLPWRATTW